LRASLSLAGIFGLRMLGMFVILPVFAIYAEQLPGGADLTLVGFAIGAYGLTQAILQLPFGWWSDRYGRKPTIYVGLVIFAVGSIVAAAAPNIYIVILGRMLQGAGAISAAVIALTADLTREEHRAKAMAMIGSTIGLAFALSLVVSPWLNKMIGVPGIFVLTAVLALAAMGVVYRLVPDAPAQPRPDIGGLAGLWRALSDPQLARLNFGIFTLHAVLMALFIMVPFSLRDAGLGIDAHWEVYLPVMLGSFVLMIPAILNAGKAHLIKTIFSGSIALILLAQLLMPWLAGGVVPIAIFLLLFFTPFNVLEAMLPTLTTRLAPAGAKGTAIGLYSSIQFFGTFVGAVAGGFAYGRWGVSGVVILDAALLVIWLILALGMKIPAPLSARTYDLPELDADQAVRLTVRLRGLPGVHEARVAAVERTAYLKVDSAGFDEQTVRKLLEGGM
ncbi:MAG: MFS transporter, partial [Burkholderiales bacterium]|nr:MFS transporter [Burkholderiales bacterium]